MQLHELNAQTWVIQGGGNIGILAYEDRCLLIDSGLDKDAGRDILKLVKKLGLTPTSLLVTHAHADHFGGAHYLVNQTGLKVYATRVEAAVMSSPILEPLYLFGGAQPPREFQHKFLLAKPSPADVLLAGNETGIDGIPLRVLSRPGHSLEQVGIAFGETLFVGDAFLVPEILDKHRIPFYSDVQSGLATLTALTTQTAAFRCVVAGHGEISRSSEQVNRAIQYMTERLQHILATLAQALADGTPRSSAELLRELCGTYDIVISTMPQYVLYQTTVQSALTTLYSRGEVEPVFQENQLLWQRVR